MRYRSFSTCVILLIITLFPMTALFVTQFAMGLSVTSTVNVSNRSRRNTADHYILQYKVAEGAPRGTILGNLGADLIQLISSKQQQLFSSKPAVALTITNWRDRAVQLFTLDSSTHSLQLVASPDRESICPSSGTMNDVQAQSEVEDFIRNKFVATNKYNKLQVDYVFGSSASSIPCYVDIKVAFRFSPSTHADLTLDTGEDLQFSSDIDPGLITTRVEIEDVNDHTPTFPQSRFVVELGELSSIPEKTVIDLPNAHDPDSGTNGSILYWLSDNGQNLSSDDGEHRTLATVTAPFRLEGNPLRLILTELLDWETIKEYHLNVHAEDCGVPKHRVGQLAVQIIVRDENDKVPTFQQEEYTVIINETVPRGTVILELTARDEDSPSNGQMSFTLGQPLNAHERLAYQHFGMRTISPNQAVIYVIQAPDVDITRQSRTSSLYEGGSIPHAGYEEVESTGQVFKFQAVVRDNGYPRQLSSKVMITIQVLDVNDMSPAIFVSYLSPVGRESVATTKQELGRNTMITELNHGTIMENVDRSFVAFVNVVDYDSGAWGRVHCQTSNEAFSLIPVTSTSTTGKDEPFDMNRYTQTIPPTGTVSSETGYKLVSTRPFDREKTAEVTFYLMCVDNVASQEPDHLSSLPGYLGRANDNTVQLTGTTIVRVLIADENDNQPVFRRQRYTFAIDEYDGPITQSNQMDTNHFIGQIDASDPDITSKISYYLDPVIAKSFRLESQTGKLFAQRVFDREHLVKHAQLSDDATFEGMNLALEADESLYLLVPITATDGKHNITTEIRLLLRDINDNIPVFSQAHYEFVVPENGQPAQSGLLGTVRAYDADSGLNAVLLYEIADIHAPELIKTNQSGFPEIPLSSKSFFTIGSKSGQLHLIRRLDREQQPVHVLHVLAIDNPRERRVDATWKAKPSAVSPLSQVVSPSHTATATVTVLVADVNDNSPRITYPPPHGLVNVESGAPAGHNLFTVTAVDPDAGENGTIRFSLTMTSFEKSKPNGRKDGITLQSMDSDKDSLNRAGTKSSSGPFAIDETTGIVFVVEKLVDHPATYLLVIEANDLGRPEQRKSTSTVSVRVQNTKALQSMNGYLYADVDKRQINERVSVRLAPDVLNTDEFNSDAKSGLPSRHINGGRLLQSERKIGRPNSLDTIAGMTRPNKVVVSRGRYLSITDRTVVVILATIFALLLMTTVVLILLIKRRRDNEQRRSGIDKQNYGVQASNNASKFDLLRSVQLQNHCLLSPTESNAHSLSPSHVRSVLIHDGHCEQSNMETPDYGLGTLYGKPHMYAGEDISFVTNHMDYQQILPTHVLSTTLPISVHNQKRAETDCSSNDQPLSNSVELLSLADQVCDDGFVAHNKQAGIENSNAHKKYVTTSATTTRPTSNRRARETDINKRYQTINLFPGTHETFRKCKPLHNQNDQPNQQPQLYSWNGEETAEPSRLKQFGEEYSELTETSHNERMLNLHMRCKSTNEIANVNVTSKLQQTVEGENENVPVDGARCAFILCDQLDSTLRHTQSNKQAEAARILGINKHSKICNSQAKGVTFV